MALSKTSLRHLPDLNDLDAATLEGLVDRACALAGGAPPQVIEQSVVNLFFEPSTRTRVSFELAAQRLGMTVVNIELERSSATKGESLEDTVATLAAMGIGHLVIRHPETGLPRRLMPVLPAGLRLLNAGDGTGEHPSQALLDAATLRSNGLDFHHARVAIVGDIRHSRVARSSARLFSRLGVADIRLAGPAGWLPDDLDLPGAALFDDLERAIDQADVIMMLRVQKERMSPDDWPDQASYHRQWGLTAERLAGAAENCRVMHPGPINRGVEIADSVADGPQSLILDQVRLGVYARMALFEWLAES